MDDPEKTIESNRSVFWNRMDYEDNAQYYLIWAVLMSVPEAQSCALVRKAYDFLRQHENEGLFVPRRCQGRPIPRLEDVS